MGRQPPTESARPVPDSRRGREQRTERSRAMTWLATSLGFGVVQLDVSVVNVAVPQIGVALGTGVSGLQWVVNAYTIGFAALIPTAGTLGDRIGAKRMLVAGFAVFTTASAVCGGAPNLVVLVAARAVQGVGAAILVPCSLSMLTHAYADPVERARAIGRWAAVGAVALSAGPLIGGVLTSALSWRWIFYINAPVGLTGVWLTVRRTTETTRAAGRGVDVAGQLLAIGTLVALAGATIEGGAHGFTSPAVLAGFVGALCAGLGFLLVESRRPSPMLPLGLFSSTTFASTTAIGVVVNTAFYGLIFALSVFFQQGRQLSPLETGLAFAPMTVAVMTANLLAARIEHTLSTRGTVRAGALLVVAGCLGSVFVGGSSSYLSVVAQLVAVGLGLGLIVPVITSALLGSVPVTESGVASGVLNTARQTGSVVGVATFGALIAGSGRLVPGLHAALVISAFLCAAVLVVARWLPRGSDGRPAR